MVKTIDSIKIGKKTIGRKYPCFIIAEAGVNHNGYLNLAKKLVDAAVSAKADAVKFQTFTASEVVTKNAGIATYAKKNIGRNLKQVDMLKQFELPFDDFKKIKKYCDNKGIIFLSSPHSFDAIDIVNEIVPAFKFGSGDITNLPALQYAAKKGKPMILGTGMSTIKEIKQAISTIRAENNNQIIALHCTTNYPCPKDEVNLRAMITMQEELDCLVGYSDHTLGLTTSLLSRALGAVVIEKHFTIDKKLPGPDHPASLDTEELKQLVENIRCVETILGNTVKKPTPSEKKIMKLVRKSLVANKDIKKEVTITREMVSIKRPGTGLPPAYLDKLVGKKTVKNIEKDELFKKEMVN